MKLKIPIIWLIAGLILFSILCFSMGCKHIYLSHEPKGDPVEKRFGICLNIVLVDSGKMSELESGCNGFYDLETNTIYSKMPDDWGDLERIETLGHELLHALGAMHSENFYCGKNEPIRWQWELQKN